MTIEVTMHLRRITAAVCEVFKSINKLNPKFMGDMLHSTCTNEVMLLEPKYIKVMYGYQTLTYYVSHLWNKLPNNVTGDISFNTSKTLRNKWNDPNC